MNNSVIYTPRIQRLAQPLHVGLDMSLYEKDIYLHRWENGKKIKMNITKFCAKHNLPDPLAVAMDQIRKATEKDQGAFVSAPIPCNCNQHGVIAFSAGGITKECTLRKNECDLINKAYDSVVNSIKVNVVPNITNKSNPEPIEVQKFVKEPVDEPEYEENIEELRQMQEAFALECDYVVKEPEGYIYGGPGEYDDMYDMPD